MQHAVDEWLRPDLGKHSSPGEQDWPEQPNIHLLEDGARADAGHGMWVGVERSSS